MTKYKIDDLVEETEVIEGFVAVLVKKLRDGYWKVRVPMGLNSSYEVWHEEDFKLCKGDLV